MKRRQKKTSSQSSLRAGALCAAFSCILILAVCGISDLTMSREWLPESASVVFAPLAVGLATFLGPLPLMRQMGKRPLPIAYGHMLGVLLVLLLLRTILGPETEFGGWVVPVCAVVGATAAGLLGGRRKGRKR